MTAGDLAVLGKAGNFVPERMKLQGAILPIYTVLLTENWDGPDRIGRNRLRIVVAWSVRRSAFFVLG
jgi:hypothetical protein